jgi:hypothetical protein
MMDYGSNYCSSRVCTEITEKKHFALKNNLLDEKPSSIEDVHAKYFLERGDNFSVNCPSDNQPSLDEGSSKLTENQKIGDSRLICNNEAKLEGEEGKDKPWGIGTGFPPTPSNLPQNFVEGEAGKIREIIRVEDPIKQKCPLCHNEAPLWFKVQQFDGYEFFVCKDCGNDLMEIKRRHQEQ